MYKYVLDDSISTQKASSWSMSLMSFNVFKHSDKRDVRLLTVCVLNMSKITDIGHPRTPLLQSMPDLYQSPLAVPLKKANHIAVFSQLTPLLKSLTYLDFLNGIFENTAIWLAKMLGVRLMNFSALRGTARAPTNNIYILFRSSNKYTIFI